MFSINLKKVIYELLFIGLSMLLLLGISLLPKSPPPLVAPVAIVAPVATVATDAPILGP